MRETLRKSRRLRKLVRWYRARHTAYPSWAELLGPDFERWQELAAREGGRRLLMATSLGGYWPGTTLESTLAVALTMRDARVDVLLCDGQLAACQLCELRGFRNAKEFATHGPQLELCKGCYIPGERYYRELGFDVLRYREFLDDSEPEELDTLAGTVPFAEIPTYRRQDVPVGEHALAGALRFFARGDLDGEPQGEPVLRRFFAASLHTEAAVRRLLESNTYERVVFHHGIYVPQGIIGEVARQLGVPVVNWNPAYRKPCFVFSHEDTYHHTLVDEPTDRWENLPWDAEHEQALLSYLKSRWSGSEDWIWFHNRPREKWTQIVNESGIRTELPIIGLLTNVIWDAQLHYPANAFRNMMEWVTETVRYFARREDLQLVIRVHPAEIRGTLPSRQHVAEELEAKFGPLPPNVFVVPPESEVSTYALLERCNAAIIYGTKTGVELAATGKPVIVAGEAWVRGKGFTHDAADRESYFELLEALPLPELDPVRLERARRYAYHIFFRRMIPLEFMEATGADPPYRLRIERLDDLAEGASPGLDVICAGILDGEPFDYPAERLGWLESAERT